MKYPLKVRGVNLIRSLPVRGAWVEICGLGWGLRPLPVSLPVRGAWVEMQSGSATSGTACRSLPVRGAWVEISLTHLTTMNPTSRSPCGERGLKSKTPMDGNE